MIFRPRRSSDTNRFVYWQVGLFFLASGVWVVSLVSGYTKLTGVAIGILLVALLLGAMGRRSSEE